MAARINPGSPNRKGAWQDTGLAFYPADVVRILRLEGIDYAQLRRILRLVRGPGEAPRSRSWARFNFQDLVGVKVAIELAGGVEAIAQGRRLRIGDVELVCARLRREGFDRPLTEVALRRQGSTIVAEVGGIKYQPLTGQVVLRDVKNAVSSFLDHQPSTAMTRRKEMRKAVVSARSRIEDASRKAALRLAKPAREAVVGLR